MDAIKFNETGNYQHITILGKEGVFTPENIDAATLPEGFYKYTLTPGEQSMFGGIAAGESEMSAGSFVTKSPLEGEGCSFTDEDWSFDHKDFDFEAHFGKKLSIDAQIAQAEAKREMIQEEKGRGKSKSRDEFEKEI